MRSGSTGRVAAHMGGTSRGRVAIFPDARAARQAHGSDVGEQVPDAELALRAVADARDDGGALLLEDASCEAARAAAKSRLGGAREHERRAPEGRRAPAPGMSDERARAVAEQPEARGALVEGFGRVPVAVDLRGVADEDQAARTEPREQMRQDAQRIERVL